jgi:sugar lactone lactonase YvrE
MTQPPTAAKPADQQATPDAGGNPPLAVVVDGLTFPEGPRWHQGELYFSDFFTHRVIAVDPGAGTAAARVRTVCEVANQPSGLGWLPDGRLLVVSMLDRRLLRLDPGGLVQHADLSGLAHSHCNDMVVGPDGRAWVGNFGFDHRLAQDPRTTCLVRVDPDGTAAVAAEDLFFPNGSAITPDRSTLIVAETWGRRLTAWDLMEGGRLERRRCWADLAPIVPDGICLDAEGAAWVAAPPQKQVLRVREGGEVTHRISTGDRGAFACALGGEDRRTLYICTATVTGPAAAEAKTGRIESIRVEVPGAGWP